MKKTFDKKSSPRKDVDTYIGKLLRFGVFLSCGITLTGGLIYLFQQHGAVTDYSPIPFGEPFGVENYLRDFSTILSGIAAFDGAAIIQLGVIALIATPILRVIFSLLIFLIEKDYLYVAITSIVLLIILTNMILGLH
ncbi:MAG: DUF1634 domain-containing protein [Prevotellaceae bacterium]|jgi:uncharacterized membrane protein|nr:DUF1634 domain-containing protein [Prevotellaceae bacterium]